MIGCIYFHDSFATPKLKKKTQKNNLFCICRPLLSRLVSFSWENKYGTQKSPVRFPIANYQKA